MIPVYLQPTDVWLFRDGKPFNAGEDHQADSIFPPLPSVIQGALRSHYLVACNVPLNDQARIEQTVGTSTHYKDLRLRGPYLRKGDELYFALPADVYALSEEDKTSRLRRFKPLDLRLEAIGQSSNPLPALLYPPENARPQKFDANRYWVSQTEMTKYLVNQEFSALNGDSLFMRESRVGIAINYAKSVTEEGALFEANFIRAGEGVGLHVEMDGLEGWPSSGLMRIGGEGHGARFTSSPLQIDLPGTPLSMKGGFKVVFITPAYFCQGWQPSDWSMHFTGQVKVQTAALQRNLSAGGYDWSKPSHSAQKPALRYVPAGSVYYFESESEVQLKQPWLCDPAPDSGQLGQVGYGQILIGQLAKAPEQEKHV
jgi:CRISPR-associated protein Cmr3